MTGPRIEKPPDTRFKVKAHFKMKRLRAQLIAV